MRVKQVTKKNYQFVYDELEKIKNFSNKKFLKLAEKKDHPLHNFIGWNPDHDFICFRNHQVEMLLFYVGECMEKYGVVKTRLKVKRPVLVNTTGWGLI